MRKFCCVCGKEGNFPDYTCPDCTERKPLKEKKERPVCQSCGRTKVDKRWVWLESTGKPNSICHECVAARGDYFEAILQFRSKKFGEAKPRIEKVFKEVMAAESKRDILVNCTKIDGKSYYFTKVKSARKMAKRIASLYRIKPKESRKLVGFVHHKGKGKYRFTIFLDLDSSKIEK